MMEENQDKLVMPSGTLAKLRCVVCSKFLSVFPIRLSPTLGDICGRCPVDHVTDVIHNTVYESAVAEFRFPCCNVTYGCVEYFLPSELLEHEQNCKYRHVSCPSANHLKCTWFGPCTQLQDHYEAEHPLYLMKHLDFEVNFVNTFDENYLLLYGDEIFIFRRKADGKSNTLYCSMVYFGWNGRPNDFRYQITLTNRSNNEKKIFDKKTTVGLDKNITEIVAAEVNECLNNPSVLVGSVEITVKEQEMQESSKQVVKPNHEMLSTIECPVCFEYMVAPIYQCLGGHSICGTCKKSISECPSCKESIKDTRNFILEGVIAYLQYPCKNWENGCTYLADPLSTKKHERLCEFSAYECPLKDYVVCHFKSKVTDLHDHIKKEHHENILEIDKVHVPMDETFSDDEDGYILKHLDRLFILHFRMTDEAFWWSIQLIGPPEHAKNYTCEIDIIDNMNKKCRFYLKGPCGSLTNKKDCFKEMPYFQLYLEQVEHFFTDTFSYQVRVLRD